MAKIKVKGTVKTRIKPVKAQPKHGGDGGIFTAKAVLIRKKVLEEFANKNG